MTKKQAISIITKCAKQYQQYLLLKEIDFSLLEDTTESNSTEQA